MIVGISGKAGAGKDTTADILCHDYGFVKLSLADPLKRVCKEIFDFSDDQLWGPSFLRNAPDYRYLRTDELAPEMDDDNYLTPRFALQTLGTEWGRHCYPWVWVLYALREATKLLRSPSRLDYHPAKGVFSCEKKNPTTGVVIPDVRFRNEIVGLKRSGAYLVRVTSDRGGLKDTAAQHKSETEQDGIPNSVFDYLIQNNYEVIGEGNEREGSEPIVHTSSLHALEDSVGKMMIHFKDSDFTELTMEQVSKDLAVTHLEARMLGKAFQFSEQEGELGRLRDLHALLEKREEDVDKGRLLPYDEEMKDVPPFIRKKKS